MKAQVTLFPSHRPSRLTWLGCRLPDVIPDPKIGLKAGVRCLLGLVWGVVLLAMVLLPGGNAPALANLHTYHERPGQTTYRSQVSLRDRSDLAWQATLFKRYHGPQLQGIYLRLVGFPGVVTVASDSPLNISTGTGLTWQVMPELDPQTQQLPENVTQYPFQAVLADLKGAIPLEMIVPLCQGQSRLAIAPFVVEEWLTLADLTPDG